MLLCSDGLSSMVSDHAIEAIMRRQTHPQHCADELVQAALENGGADNVTVIVADVAGFTEARENKKARKSRVLYISLAVALIAIIFAAAFGGYSYINNSAYLIEEDGKISVYRGVPDEFMGMKLSVLDRTTSVEVDKLQPGVANRIKEGMSVTSMDEANSLIEGYELEIARAEVEAARSSLPGTDASQSDEGSNAGNGTSGNGGER